MTKQLSTTKSPVCGCPKRYYDCTYMSSAYSIQKKFCHFILSVKLSLTHTQICLSLRESYDVKIEKITFFTRSAKCKT